MSLQLRPCSLFWVYGLFLLLRQSTHLLYLEAVDVHYHPFIIIIIVSSIVSTNVSVIASFIIIVLIRSLLIVTSIRPSYPSYNNIPTPRFLIAVVQHLHILLWSRFLLRIKYYLLQFSYPLGCSTLPFPSSRFGRFSRSPISTTMGGAFWDIFLLLHVVLIDDQMFL